jgi:hypothetical protein
MIEAVAVTTTGVGTRIGGIPVAGVMALGTIAAENPKVKSRIAVA